MTLKEILKKELYAWFRERSNRAATAKQIQEAFPDYSPEMVEKVLSGRSSKGHYDFRVYDADEGTYCLYAKDFLYPEAETPKKEEKPEVETKKKLTIRERVENWFRERGNEPATLREVQAAFPDVNPKSISGTLSGKDKNGEYNFNADYSSNPMRYYTFLPVEEAVEEAVRLASCGGDCSHCEAETFSSEEEQEIESISPEKMLAAEFFSSNEAESQSASEEALSSIAKSLESIARPLKSIAKSLVQMAKVENALAKRFLEK